MKHSKPFFKRAIRDAIPPIMLRDITRHGATRQLEGTLILRKQTSKQLIQVVYSDLYGYILVLDDEIQLASKDQSLYHRYLVEPSLDNFCPVEREVSVLLLGGGDGFALQNALAFKRIRNVTLIDHDDELVDIFANGEAGKIFGTSGAFKDPRTSVVISDACKFLEGQPRPNWDIIIVDLTDNWIDGTLLESIARGSAPGALISIHMASSDASLIDCCIKMRSLGIVPFGHWKMPIPSFGEEWSFVLSIKGEGIRKLADRWREQHSAQLPNV